MQPNSIDDIFFSKTIFQFQRQRNIIHFCKGTKREKKRCKKIVEIHFWCYPSDLKSNVTLWAAAITVLGGPVSCATDVQDIPGYSIRTRERTSHPRYASRRTVCIHLAATIRQRQHADPSNVCLRKIEVDKLDGLWAGKNKTRT